MPAGRRPLPDEHRIAVIGLHGSGKSTPVRLPNGLLLPTRGAAEAVSVLLLLAPPRYLGPQPARTGPVLSMTIRFIPQGRSQYLEVREVQFARGLHHSPVAVLAALIAARRRGREAGVPGPPRAAQRARCAVGRGASSRAG